MPAGTVVTDKVLETLRSRLEMPELELVLKEEWSSENPDYRMKIREGLLKRLEQLAPLSEQQREEILDLMRIPFHPQVGISISHNKKCGGFALNPREALGFDVEIVGRVKDKVVARASSANEYVGAPSPASLWTAKEAALKSFHGAEQAPEVLGQVEVGEWNVEAGGIESCSASAMNPGAKLKARGCVVDIGDMKLAVFRRH